MNTTAVRLAAAGSCMLSWLALPALAEDAITLEMHSAFPAVLRTLGGGGLAFAERVGELTGGKVQVTFKAAPNPLELFDKIDAKQIDAAWTIFAYYPTRVPGWQLMTEVPFFAPPNQLLSWLYHGGGRAMVKTATAGTNVMAIPTMVLPATGGLWAREPIASLADLRSKPWTVRFFGPATEVIARVAPNLQIVSGNAAFIHAGMVDGTLQAWEFADPASDEDLFFDVFGAGGQNPVALGFRYLHYPGWQQRATLVVLLVRRDLWDGPLAPYRSQFERAGELVALESLTRGEALGGKALLRFEREGVRIRPFPGEVLQELAAETAAWMAEVAAADPAFAALLASQRAYHAAHGYDGWREFADGIVLPVLPE